MHLAILVILNRKPYFLFISALNHQEIIYNAEKISFTSIFTKIIASFIFKRVLSEYASNFILEKVIDGEFES